MNRSLLVLGLLASLSACSDGQPFEFGNPTEPVPGPEDPTDNGVPEDIRGNLNGATYTPPSGDDNGRLVVEIASLDTTPVEAAYRRRTVLDVCDDGACSDGEAVEDGYVAYTMQEDPLDRFFIGLARQSRDGSVEGTVVVDGGQFNTYFGGVNYGRNGAYSPHVPDQPDNGLVSYAGAYVGMLNGPVPRPNEALDVPAGTDPALLPGQAIRVQGDVFLNADFADNAVNGAIYNREAVDALPGDLTLKDLALTPADIGENGRFEGQVEPDNEIGTAIGSYGGVFGGTGATAVAGGVRLEGDFIAEVENEQEYGLFVLDRCGEQSTADVCNRVEPDVEN
ncbi:thymidylate synthase [Rubellimicrobium roseum]|uniref:Thymidylate synthase n=1 Tax=Rubellimicrobium roseum TaxID=687525 RepID=A0A5C4N9U7_9RHOB|nr:thymidylate synthase [Rubellimicrobium roseum]TNC71614.1 thymidylate synthase [Rubellimicrobium roseum]